ncbi:Asp-tRNA(Asn)/Glu-tRNA(Gln) amidotransferase subunit GatB [Exiguobacterium flavidum]|uniref:Asp-tRNA(Asn)/Glu-tRNA(Gln) amidotransferase subunit GatB n=1 Tax=Exiguobacterium flavidum TaxID=2184695 RepID=UPI000DF813E7|nr:Asp-tRNA(Asn)/Glu-tRNA(Gln) amidotransferase subunit GatB [Exiguobacterium flavidum]
MNFETVIGIEVHAELKTNTKIFCGCSREYGAETNTQTCPICLGHPGVLPTLNEKAVELAVRAAMALNCQVADETKFDRKNYFYPDTPKAYQISQFDKPIGFDGYIDAEVDGVTKRFRIERVHLEEDAGKMNHTGENHSVVDFNRTGSPLIEIVSEADMRSPKEAVAYLERLKEVLQYADISDVKMEEGSLRCDCNISVRPYGQEKFGTKTELKNLNSFGNVLKGLEYEEDRHRKLLLSGGVMRQETLRFDEAGKKTVLMRVKEGASDYRYFPEPDLVKLVLDNDWKEAIRAGIPELPDARRVRYQEAFGLSPYDAKILTTTRETAEYFEAVVAEGADAKAAANWTMGEVQGHLNKSDDTFETLKLTPVKLTALIGLISDGTISSKIAKQVFQAIIDEGVDPAAYVEEKGLAQISDEGLLRGLINESFDAHPEVVEELKGGRDRKKGFVIGQVMKKTKGMANPTLLDELFYDELAKR